MRLAMHGLYGLSILGFFIALFASYLNITPLVSLAEAGIPFYEGYISSDTYFYLLFVLFLLANVPIFVLIQTLNRLPGTMLISPRPSFWKQDRNHAEGLKRLWKNYGYAVMSGLNMVLLALSVNIMMANHIDGNVPVSYLWMYPVSLLILGFSILLPLVRMFIPRLNFMPSK